MLQDERIRALTQDLYRFFQDLGALGIEPDVLQPAELLLDLYGEDIRARAYLASDPLRGEQMLRPDYTVPVVQTHMEGRANPARYTYAGKVFRKQEQDAKRASEYIQVGYECFGDEDPAAADAEVFVAMSNALSVIAKEVKTGDMNVLMAAVSGLRASEYRKAALLRHIWRPRRFRALLERYAGRAEKSSERLALLAAEDPFANAGPFIGIRSKDEIEQRLARLRHDEEEPPISGVELDLLSAIAKLSDTYPNSLRALHDLEGDLPSISDAIMRIERRLDALETRGIDTASLGFEASYGRTSMEYYDGFVFGFYSAAGLAGSPVATGGRYDALTRHLGNGVDLPAVGGVIRPDLLIAAQERDV